VLSPKELDGGDPLGRGAAPPVRERAVGPRRFGEARHGQAPSIAAEFHWLILVENALELVRR
jgi:hypothetical protein